MIDEIKFFWGGYKYEAKNYLSVYFGLHRPLFDALRELLLTLYKLLVIVLIFLSILFFPLTIFTITVFKYVKYKRILSKQKNLMV